MTAHHRRKILFVASEAHPLMKTGGLADVGGGLSQALQTLGADVRLLMPGYRDTLARAGDLQRVTQLVLPPLTQPITLLEGRLPDSRVKVWLIDYAPAFGRRGNPYLDAQGLPWHDNAARFALLARVAVAIARASAGLSWQPDVVHAHDWQSGLVPALLAGVARRPATVFTIHNLAYQGLFPHDVFQALRLPEALWTLDALEFHGQLSFIKGGIALADRVNTVSPTYAREIQTAEQGFGLDGLLRHRAARLSGILNGIDTRLWDPARDPVLTSRYSLNRLEKKSPNKLALQREFGLRVAAEPALFGMVSRLVEQKGVDLLLAILPALMQWPVQVVVQGSGEARFEQALRDQAALYPGRLAVFTGYSEEVAHRIQAGADFFLMPSRFEPCGLSQLYSLRYGTVPVVHGIGGLSDTVIDADLGEPARTGATGLVFRPAAAAAFLDAIHRALNLYADRRRLRQVQRTGMRLDYSWRHSASGYQQLYEQALADAETRPGLVSG